MALNATTLRDLIDTKYAAINSDYSSSDFRDEIKEGLIQAIAEAVVEHIAAEAVVTTSTPNGTSGSDTLAGTGTVA